MWQFLLELLTDKSCQQFISWTGDGWEFKLTDPDEVSSTTNRITSRKFQLFFNLFSICFQNMYIFARWLEDGA